MEDPNRGYAWHLISQFVAWEFCKSISKPDECDPKGTVKDMLTYFREMIVNLTTKPDRDITKHEVISKFLEEIRFSRSQNRLKVAYCLLQRLKYYCPQLTQSCFTLYDTFKEFVDASDTKNSHSAATWGKKLDERIKSFSEEACDILPTPDLLKAVADWVKMKNKAVEPRNLAEKAEQRLIQENLSNEEVTYIIKEIRSDKTFMKNFENCHQEVKTYPLQSHAEATDEAETFYSLSTAPESDSPVETIEGNNPVEPEVETPIGLEGSSVQIMDYVLTPRILRQNQMDSEESDSSSDVAENHVADVLETSDQESDGSSDCLMENNQPVLTVFHNGKKIRIRECCVRLVDCVTSGSHSVSNVGVASTSKANTCLKFPSIYTNSPSLSPSPSMCSNDEFHPSASSPSDDEFCLTPKQKKRGDAMKRCVYCEKFIRTKMLTKHYRVKHGVAKKKVLRRSTAAKKTYVY